MTASYNLSQLGSHYNQGGTGAVDRTTASKLQESVSVLDFGADPTGTNDSAAAIQAAIDWVTYQDTTSPTSLGSVYIPAGIYKVSTAIQLGYGEAFHSVHIYGAGQRYRGATGFAGTAIIPTFNDRPVFAVNGGRNTTIERLSIKGLNYNWCVNNNLGVYGTPTVNDLIAANWVDPGLPASASSQYAPYCAIAIDPYAGTAPATPYPNVSFPSWSGITTQYGKNYSSMTVIRDVGISGFVVGIANQPCNADGNGDFTKVQNCNIEYCQYAISIGNTNSRLFHVVDSTIQNVYCGLTTSNNGVQNGQPGVCFDNTEIAFSINWLICNSMGLSGGMAFRNCYGETVYSLGQCNPGNSGGLSTITFDSCSIGFHSWDNRGIPTAIFSYAGGGGAIFNACEFRPGFTAQPNFFPMNVAAELVSINNCIAFAGQSATHYYEKFPVNATGGFITINGSTNFASFSIKQPYSWNLNTGAAVTVRNINSTSKSTNRTYCIPIYTKSIVAADAQAQDGGFSFILPSNAIAKSACASITTSGNTVTVDCTGSVSSAWMLTQEGGDVGDVLTDTETGATFIVSSRTGLVLTLIAQTGLTSSGNVAVAPTTTGYFWARNCRLYTPYYVTYGDLSTASSTVANFQRPDSYAGYINNADQGIQVGDQVYTNNGSADYKVSPASANISSIGTNSFVMGAVAGYTQTRVRMTLFVRASPANGT
jgi:Pectate lyase superfamily protein